MFGTLGSVVWNADHRRLRTPWRLGAALALFLLATVVIASAGRSVSGLVDGPLGNAWATLLQAAVFLVLTGVVAGIGWFVDRRRIADLGLSLDGSWYREAGVGFGVGLAMATTVVGIGLATGVATVAGTFQIRSGVALPAPGTGVVLATLLYVPFFLGVGILEEVILRGYLLTNVAEGLRTILDDRAAVVAAVCATALLFGVLHAANPGGTALGVVNVGLAGLLLGGAYALTGRLALPVGVHAAWNFAVGPVYGLPVSGLRTGTAVVAVEGRGGRLLSGGEFGPEGGLVMLGGLVVGAVLLARWIEHEEGSLRLRSSIAVPDLRGPVSLTGGRIGTQL